MKKPICEENFAEVKVIKASMKTKENGENIYKIMNAWVRNCRTILVFMKNEIKDTKRGTGKKIPRLLEKS